MKKSLAVLFCLGFISSCATVKPATYEETVAHWTSYKDVAFWLDKNFQIDWSRSTALDTMRGWQPRTPEQTFKLESGVCQDSANFARDTLNRVNSDYRARIVFIQNSGGSRHHWVTEFRMNGKLYIMDYGAGGPWLPMNGVHGPYDSLKEYEQFLSSLHVPRFVLESVRDTNR